MEISGQRYVKNDSDSDDVYRPHRCGDPFADEVYGNQYFRQLGGYLQFVPDDRQDCFSNFCVPAGGRIFSHAQQGALFRAACAFFAVVRNSF